MSRAMIVWNKDCAASLDELERIHAAARGRNRGRRWGTEQLNRSLFVVLVGQFQVYCRELHNEAISVYVAEANERQVTVLENLLRRGRRLDTHNPDPSSLGSDFGRLGFGLVPSIKARRRKGRADLERLELLVKLRNAIAHGNESEVQSLTTGKTKLTLQSFRVFRKTLDRIVRDMDAVVANELAAGLQIRLPW